MKSTSNQRIQISKLTGYNKEVKLRLVLEITKDPKRSSTKDLSPMEAQTLINSLATNWGAFDNSKQSHKYILSLLIQIGWTKQLEPFGTVADINRLSEFLKSVKSPVNKPLKSMSPAEVSQKLIPALESMTSKKYNKKPT
jgi:hypothetical protein